MAPPPLPQPNQQQQSSDQTAPIPLYYRLPLLYIEPICALGGAFMLLSSPKLFLNAVSPNHAPSLYEGGDNLTSLPHGDGVTTPATAASQALDSVRILTDMLGIMHLVFAFNLAVVLRAVRNDRGLWRVICTGMLLSDCLHLATTVREYGWDVSFDPTRWRGHDWVNFGTLWSMAILRVGIVLGVGLGGGVRKENKVKGN